MYSMHEKTYLEQTVSASVNLFMRKKVKNRDYQCKPTDGHTVVLL
jgi:hypothetical protein